MSAPPVAGDYFFTSTEVDLLQDAVATLLADYLMKDRMDEPIVRHHYNMLVTIGRKLGMEL